MKREREQPPVAPPPEPRFLVRWKCPDCRITQSGYITRWDHQPRVCRGIPRTGPQIDTDGARLPCGAIMDTVHDERQA